MQSAFRKYSIVFFSYMLVSAISAQNQNTIDSLKKLLNDPLNDSAKVNLLDDICWEYKYSNPDSAMLYCRSAAELAKKNNFKKSLSRIFSHWGIVYEVKGNYEKAMEFQVNALRISEAIKDSILSSSCLSNIGIIYDFQGRYEDALKYLEQALKISRNIQDSQGIATRLLNIGDVYNHTGNNEKALENYSVALSLAEALLLKSKENPDDKNSRHLKKLIANNTNNVGTIHYKLGQSSQALYYYQKSLVAKESLNDLSGAANTIINIAGVHLQMGNFQEAIAYCGKGIDVAKKINSKLQLQHAYGGLSEIYGIQKNYRKAYENHILYSQMKDSLLNEKSSKQITEMQTKYETEKKELQIENLNKDNAIKETEIKKQNIQKFAFASGFLLTLILAFVIFRSYSQKKKANEIISAQKSEVEKQKKIVDEKNSSLETAYKHIEEKNTEILDSIRYAKRIQEAILPPQKLVKQYLEESFILYKPKDIVAGDFYWMEPKENKVLFASVDCTGHGVPGAFVSILGYNGLNHCVKEFGLIQPAKILDKLCELVDEAFSKSEADIKDGMDIALCCYDYKNNILEYSGAGNSLYHIRNNNLTEHSADKQPVGKFAYRKPFSNRIIDLQKNDAIYIFTDGYADQFGGPKGKKFKYAQFEKLLVSIQDKSMMEQREILNETIEKWRGELEQIDDICVIGVRV